MDLSICVCLVGKQTKEPLIKSVFVIPAQAGIYKNQQVMDSRLRGDDPNQRLPNSSSETIGAPTGSLSC
jgi:hypothetical protein